MFNRKILDDLAQWAARKDRKPLVLRGARQVGKTTAVELFARQFDQFLHFDLEARQDREIFERNLPFPELAQVMFLARNESRKAGRVLIFLDEIQASPGAVGSLRFFSEQAPDLHVVAAGSLLELMLARFGAGFPVGRVEYLFMYPLSFEEFLAALGMESALEMYRTIPFPEHARHPLLSLFHRYAQVGGMPEAVRRYSESQDILSLKPVYQGLITSFMDDVGKYSRSSAMTQTLRFAIEAAPLEAGKRIRFHGFGRSNYRSREMGEALRVLERAMILHLLYPTTGTGLPAQPDLRKSPRLQFLDTGLLNFAAGLQQALFMMHDLHGVYQGILAEHLVAQELIARDAQVSQKPAFWVRESKASTAEVDFVLPFRGFLIPVEVKAGSSGTLRSLHQFVDQADHPWAVRLYSGPLRRDAARTQRGKDYLLLSLPYFLAGQIDRYLRWMVG